jgi:predicted adenylyl cyclase CyaB
MSAKQSYEIEVKSLLGGREEAERLKGLMSAKWPGLKMKTSYKQLNHYFIPGDFSALLAKIGNNFSEEEKNKYEDAVRQGKSFSVRSREYEGSVILVIKASLDANTSANGISRMEFEAKVPLSLQELDAKLLDSGFSYQAKWSREREEYPAPNITVCIDKNAGYGYLAEFEKVIQDQKDIPVALNEIKAVMQEFGISELPQDRLERMFEHYNKHWSDYYGTEKTFTIA